MNSSCRAEMALVGSSFVAALAIAALSAAAQAGHGQEAEADAGSQEAGLDGGKIGHIALGGQGIETGTLMLGHAVAGGGDVNGDGVPDFVCGNPGGIEWGSYTGEARVYSGKDGGHLFTVTGWVEKQCFGWSVLIPGDLNADGCAEVVVGSLFGNRVAIFSGKDGSLLRSLRGRDRLGGAWFGASLASIADLDGDGVVDLAVGEPRRSLGLSYDSERMEIYAVGCVHVFSGRTGAEIFELWPREKAEDEFLIGEVSYFGRSVAAAGDVDGDGVQDIAVGAPGEAFVHFTGRSGLVHPRDRCVRPVQLSHRLSGAVADRAEPEPGSAFVFSGRDASLLQAFSIGRAWNGFGCAVAAVGDVNADGKADVAVGAYRDHGEAGEGGSVRVFSGGDGTELACIRGSTGSSELGYSLASVPDSTKEGSMWLLVGDPTPKNRMNSQGRVMLMDLVSGSPLHTFSEGYNANRVDDFGFSVSAIGDADGDGWCDLVVGALDWGAPGEIYAYSGKDGKQLYYCGQ